MCTAKGQTEKESKIYTPEGSRSKRKTQEDPGKAKSLCTKNQEYDMQGVNIARNSLFEVYDQRQVEDLEESAHRIE